MKGLQSLIVKVASRCNLNCSYCYVYNKGDLTYRDQPKYMSQDTVDALLLRVKNHILSNRLDVFQFVFHGGEPLLASKEFYRYFVEKANRKLARFAAITYSVQTNGVLLDDEWGTLLKELSIYIGISFDGTREIHNRYRVNHAGKGSFDEVVRGIGICNRHQPASILSVVNIESDPAEVYETIRSIGAVSYDLLLPDATYDAPEPQMNFDPGNDDTPYGDWLVRLYEYWKCDRCQPRITIQFFESIIKMLIGEKSGNALIGNMINNILVIQTDGSYESPLKTGIHGFTRTNYNVFKTEFDEIFDDWKVKLYHDAHLNICDTCASCPVHSVCGGGLVSHRFSRKDGFNNPSVYCKDLMRIITHIQNDFVSSMPEETAHALGLERLTYGQARSALKNSLNMLHELQ